MILLLVRMTFVLQNWGSNLGLCDVAARCLGKLMTADQVVGLARLNLRS